jgi:hypothetical protein
MVMGIAARLDRLATLIEVSEALEYASAEVMESNTNCGVRDAEEAASQLVDMLAEENAWQELARRVSDKRCA